MTGTALRICLLVALFISRSMPVLAADVAWTMQSFQGANEVVTQELAGFAERLREQTSGRIELDILPAGEVVPNDETPLAIKAGLLDGHYNTPSYFARLDPAFAILGDTLSAYPDPETRDRWFDEGGGLELARKLYAKNGLYFIGPVYWPVDWMPSALPLNGVADLKGMRIRSPGGLVGDLLRQAGGEVVQLPTRQIQKALLSADIDATDWADMAVNRASGLYNAAPYNVLLRHSMVLTEISVGLAAWEALPDDLKPVLEQAVRDFSAQMKGILQEEERLARDEIEALGVTSIEWDSAEARTFQKHLIRVWQRWRSRSAFAAELIDSHMAFIEQADFD